MATQHTTVTAVPDLGVQVVESGVGEPPIVLLPALDLEEGEEARALLAERRRLLAVEHPGFGTAPALPGLETVRELAHHYLAWLDTLDGPVHLVGASLGGWIAAEMASADTRRVRSLTLVAPMGIYVPDAVPVDIFMLDAEHFDRLRYHDPTVVPSGGFDRTYRIRNMAMLAMYCWNPRLHDPSLPRRLERVRAPTLVVWGAEDRMLDARHADAFAAALPSARVEIVPDAGHALIEEHPQRVAPVIADFHDTVDREVRS
jgi:pimeloyl-ACP methyl ester carboxylesterase